MACQQLPAVSFNDDCNPDVFGSEIEELFIANADATALTDWSSGAEWALRLDQAGVVGDEIRRLTVTGDKPAASAVIVAISKRRNKKIDANHVINADIDDVSATNYTAALAWQNGVRVRVWWKNRGGNLFGGNEGILVDLDANIVHGRGDEVEKIQLTATWNSKTDPLRIVSPI